MPALLDATLPAQAAAGADVVISAGEIPVAGGANTYLRNIRITSPSLVTGVVTNNAAISVRRYRAGVLQETAGTITLGVGTNLPASTAVDLPVATPYVLPGDTFDVLMHQNGTGLALPVGIAVNIEIG